MRRQRGSAAVKLLVWVLALALLASAGLFAYVTTQEALDHGGHAVGTNRNVTVKDGRLRPVPDGQIYVAAVIRNTGRFPLTLEGLGAIDDPDAMPYVPADIRLGNGSTPALQGSAEFSPPVLDPGTGIGVLVVFSLNREMDCSRFSEARGGVEYRVVPLRYTTFGIPKTQELDFGEALFEVERPTREDCERLTG